MKNLGLVLLFVVGCASKPCREPQPPRQLQTAQEAMAHIYVAKSDGAKQCEPKTGVTPEKMESQLKGVKVYSRASKSDGLMRTSVCGASAGKFNVYEIDKSELDKAKKLGFQEWKPEN